MGITIWFDGGLVAFGKAVQECGELLRADLVDRAITEFLEKPLDDGLLESHRIFIEWGS